MIAGLFAVPARAAHTQQRRPPDGLDGTHGQTWVGSQQLSHADGVAHHQRSAEVVVRDLRIRCEQSGCPALGTADAGPEKGIYPLGEIRAAGFDPRPERAPAGETALTGDCQQRRIECSFVRRCIPPDPFQRAGFTGTGSIP